MRLALVFGMEIGKNQYGLFLKGLIYKDASNDSLLISLCIPMTVSSLISSGIGRGCSR